MKFSKLFSNTPLSLAELEITELTHDTRTIKPGSLFFALEGQTQDGHVHLKKLLKDFSFVKNSVAIIRANHPESQELLKLPNIIAVPNPRLTLGFIANQFYGNPSHKLIVCCVTGTNGKTSSTYLLESLFKSWGISCGVIGTIENRFEKYSLQSSLTTPDAIGLQSLLKNFVALGAKAVAMEVSSHALDQHRLAGTQLSAALFTNLTQDHLDYHKTIENYFQAKSKLFLEYSPDVRAINIHDPYGQKLEELCRKRNLKIITFGCPDANIYFEDLQVSSTNLKGTINMTWNGAHQKLKIQSPLIGNFNANNIAGCVAVAVGLEMPLTIIQQGLLNIKPILGRMQTIPNSREVMVLIDYAHTPDALKQVLLTLRRITKGRLICLFGCGGNRDSTKRPVMGAIVDELADLLIVTSDNPRSENPAHIIDQIYSGISNTSHATRIPSRKAAIQHAISILKPRDTLLIAGKGHEKYQIIGQEKLLFDDYAIALESLNNA